MLYERSEIVSSGALTHWEIKVVCPSVATLRASEPVVHAVGNAIVDGLAPRKAIFGKPRTYFVLKSHQTLLKNETKNRKLR